MKKAKAFMYLIGYDRSFKENCKTGWGCGYVAIPFTHRLVKKHFKRLTDEAKQELKNPDSFFISWKYLEIQGIYQEITYTEKQAFNGIDYLVAGFDTAHSYNNDSHDIKYVMTETQKILEIINNY